MNVCHSFVAKNLYICLPSSYQKSNKDSNISKIYFVRLRYLGTILLALRWHDFRNETKATSSIMAKVETAKKKNAICWHLVLTKFAIKIPSGFLLHICKWTFFCHFKFCHYRRITFRRIKRRGRDQSNQNLVLPF